MKTVFSLLLCFCSLCMTAQKYGFSSSTDEFTGESIIVSDWQKLSVGFGGNTYNSYLMLCRIDSSYFLNLKVMTMEVAAVEEGARFMIKMEDGEVVTFVNPQYVLSDRGDGAINFGGSSAMGVHIVLPCESSQITALGAQKIEKCRLEARGKYYELAPGNKAARNLQEYFLYASQLL
ncbi:MAG: hypothetical protein AAFO03_00825 [Bacteroidota bacterium]